MSQSARQGLEGRNDLDRRLLSTSSNRPLQEKSNSGDSSGRSSPYTESMAVAAEDEERKRLAAVVEDLSGIIAFSCLLIVIITISLSGSVPSLRPDGVNPNAAHAAIPLDSPAAEQPPTYAIWPILGRLFSLAIALVTALLVGLSLRRPGDGDHDPTQHDAWYRVTLCLYIIALVKLLLGVDFGLFITVTWWIGFLSVAPHHLARGRAVARTLREHQRFLHRPGYCIPAYNM